MESETSGPVAADGPRRGRIGGARCGTTCRKANTTAGGSAQRSGAQVIFKTLRRATVSMITRQRADRAGWNALLDTKHKDLTVRIADKDRDLLLDWVVAKFGPDSRPFPRAYVPPEITTFFSDAEAQALLETACTRCHGLDRVNDTRYSPDKWRVTALDMRQRGAKVTDEELERLVEWLGRVKGTNPNQ